MRRFFVPLPLTPWCSGYPTHESGSGWSGLPLPLPQPWMQHMREDADKAAILPWAIYSLVLSHCSLIWFHFTACSSSLTNLLPSLSIERGFLNTCVDYIPFHPTVPQCLVCSIKDFVFCYPTLGSWNTKSRPYLLITSHLLAVNSSSCKSLNVSLDNENFYLNDKNEIGFFFIPSRVVKKKEKKIFGA